MTKRTSACIILRSKEDLLAEKAIHVLADQATSGAVTGFFASYPENPLDAVVVKNSGDGLQNCQLLDELASMRNLHRIRVVSIVSAVGQDSASDVAEGAKRLRSILNENRGAGMKIDDLRVLLPASGQPLLADDFFSASANVNVVVIPHDRADDRMFARLVLAEDEERFASHIAVEVGSIAALWSSMATGPFDDLTPAAAADRDPKVVLVRSMVRALHCPGISSDDILQEGKSLPLPDTDLGFVRSPDPEWTIERVADAAIPQEFRYTPAAPDEEATEYVERKEAWAIFRKRYASTLWTVPKIVFSSLTEDFDVLSADAVQEAVGRESWLQVVVPNYYDNDSGETQTVDTSEALRQIELSDASPMYAGISESTWRSIVDIPLGVADGGAAARPLLENAGDYRFVVVDQPLLASRPRDTAELTIQMYLDEIDLLVSGRPHSGSDSALTSENELSEVNDDPVDSKTEVPEVHAQAAVASDDIEITEETELSVTTPDLSESELLENGADDHFEGEEIESGAPTSARTDVTDSTQEPEFAPLITRIGAGIRLQQRAAEESLKRSVESIRNIVESNSLNRVHAVSIKMRILLALGLATAIFAVTVFTGVARYTSLEWIDEGWTKTIWIAVAVALLASSIVVHVASRAGLFARLGILTLILAIAIVVAILPWIRDSDFIREHIGRGRWVAWPLTAGLLAIALIGHAQLRSDDVPWRKALSRINIQFTLLFVYVCIVVGASSYKSFLQPVARSNSGLFSRVVHLSDNTRQRLLIVVLVAGLVILLGTVSKITSDLVRSQLLKTRRSRDFVWAVQEARRASIERRRIEMLLGQWLGTVASVARVIWYPLGANAVASLPQRRSEKSDLDLRKFENARLELTARGSELMTENIRSEMIRRGWLKDQYRRAAESFVSTTPRVVNEKIPKNDWQMPETCSNVASIRDIVHGDAYGDRWSFMRSLYEGNFDRELGKLPNNIQVDDLFASVVENDQHCKLLGGSNNEIIAAEFFDGLIPEAHQTLPVGLVRGVVFIADDQKLEMDSKVVWPEVFTGREIPEQQWLTALEHDSSMSVGGSVVTAVRVDTSRNFSLSEVAGGFADVKEVPEATSGPLF